MIDWTPSSHAVPLPRQPHKIVQSIMLVNDDTAVWASVNIASNTCIFNDTWQRGPTLTLESCCLTERGDVLTSILVLVFLNRPRSPTLERALAPLAPLARCADITEEKLVQAFSLRMTLDIRRSRCRLMSTPPMRMTLDTEDSVQRCSQTTMFRDPLLTPIWKHPRVSTV